MAKRGKMILLLLAVMAVLALFAACGGQTYTIVFRNEDGTVLETVQVGKGEMPVYSEEEPTKASTAANTYEFDGWDAEIVPAEGDATYTATYTSAVRKYTIVFQNGETVLQSTQVEYGTLPAYTGEEPEKTADAQYSYTFSGWDKEVTEVSGDATYTAQFTQTLNSYTVTWKNGDTVLETDENVEYGTVPVYNGAEPVKDEDNAATYQFDGWDKEIAAVTGDVTYTAKFAETKKVYTIKFFAEDGSTQIGETLSLHWDDAIQKPDDPSKDSTNEKDYTFAGWKLKGTDDVVAVDEKVAGNREYVAVFTETDRMYQIRFEDYDGTQIGSTLSLTWGAEVTPPEAPSRDATVSTVYTFAGWNNGQSGVVPVAGDATYTATYTESVRTYDVVFYDQDGKTVLYTDEDVEYGATPVYEGKTPSRVDLGYWEFAGWDFELEPVNGENLIYMATYNAVYEYKMIATDEEGNLTDVVSTFAGIDDATGFLRVGFQKSATYRFIVEGVDYTRKENVSLSFQTNYTGIVFTAPNGVKLLSSTEKATVEMIVDQTGKIYIDGVEVAGAMMEEGVLSFDLTRDPATHPYAELCLGYLAFDVEIKPLTFVNRMDNFFTPTTGSVSTAEAGEAEKALGMSKVNTATITGWQNKALNDLPLSDYRVIRFYVKRDTTLSLYQGNQQRYSLTGGEWTEVRMTKNGSGTYDVTVSGGTKITDFAPITNLNEIEFNCNKAGENDGIFYFSNLMVDSDSYVPMVEEKLSIDLCVNSTGTKEAQELTAAETSLGITSVTKLTFDGWQHKALADLDLMQYETVKFYLFRPSSGGGGNIYDKDDGDSTGHIVDMAALSDRWVEIELRKNADGTGFSIYADGILKEHTFQAGALTNLNQLALNGSTGSILYSNLFVYSLA